jgi:peptide/nickel transport system substrate-binding protein/oligopeptide transport system substrate-binding protein
MMRVRGLIACLLLACGGPSGGPPEVLFRVRLSADPPSLDPIHAADAISGAVVHPLFDGLVAADPATGAVQPALAERFEPLEGGRAWRFHLRPDARFHHGRPVTAEDVRFSFERVLDPESQCERPWVLTPLRGASAFREGRADRVAGIRVEDERTVVLEIEEPFTPFLAQLTMAPASIVPRELVARDPQAFSAAPVGSGPFRFVRWARDVEIELEAFDGAWDGRPGIDRLRFVILPNVNVAYQAFRAGEIELLNQLPTGALSEARRERPQGLRVWTVLSTRYLGMNLAGPPFSDNRPLRQALNYAVNREALCRDVLQNLAEPASGVVPSALLPVRPEGYAYDPDRARTLLVQAGFPEGKGLPELELWYNASQEEARIWQVVASDLAAIGVHTRLVALEWGAFLSAIRAGRAPLFRGSWVGDYADPHNFLFVLLHSGNAGPEGNYARFGDPEFDRLVEAAGSESDPVRRGELYVMAEARAVAEAPWVFLFHPRDEVLIAPGWAGLEHSILGDWAIPLERVRASVEAQGDAFEPQLNEAAENAR